MELPVDKIRFLRENKWSVAGLIVFIFVLIFVINLILGNQNCNITTIKNGVIQKCDCTGLEITVKSTESSGEQKTICLGRVSNKVEYQKIE